MHKNTKSIDYHNDWLHRVMQEPILNDSFDKRIFRFTWKKALSHFPIIIGLLKHDDMISLYWKEFDVKNKKIVEGFKQLKPSDWNDIVKKINSVNFWELPTYDTSLDTGLDGSTWILEAKQMHKYHFVSRWCGNGIEKIGLKLIQLTDLILNKHEIY